MPPMNELVVTDWGAGNRRRPGGGASEASVPVTSIWQLPLLRWFSIYGLVAFAAIGIPIAAVLSHFMTQEILDHDAALSSQFIVKVADSQSSQARLRPSRTLGLILDERADLAAVARIHKEPDSLRQMIDRGHVLVWLCTAYGVVILYLVLLWFIHRVHITLGAQQQRLVEAEALCAFGEMSAAVVHGIRSPLACMRSSAELALDGDLESSRKNATDIVVQIDRLGAWVRDLLAFSRPVTRQDQQVDLDSLVEQCLSHFLGQLEKSRITCEFENSPSGLSLVLGERSLVMQALANVVANAIEAMPNGGALRLAVRRENRLRRAVLVVSDSGCGMSPTELQQVFKPYFTTKPEGLGLGMSLTKRIMERFGGAISLCSRKGEGTRTSLSFRLA